MLARAGQPLNLVSRGTGASVPSDMQVAQTGRLRSTSAMAQRFHPVLWRAAPEGSAFEGRSTRKPKSCCKTDELLPASSTQILSSAGRVEAPIRNILRPPSSIGPCGLQIQASRSAA